MKQVVFIYLFLALAIPSHGETLEELKARADGLIENLLADIVPRQEVRRAERKAAWDAAKAAIDAADSEGLGGGRPRGMLLGFRQWLPSHSAPPAHTAGAAADAVPDRVALKPGKETASLAEIDPVRTKANWPFSVRCDTYGNDEVDGYRLVFEMRYEGTLYRCTRFYEVTKDGETVRRDSTPWAAVAEEEV